MMILPGLLAALLPFLQGQEEVDPKRLAALAAQLADEDWNTREKAEAALADMGAVAIPALKKLLGHADLEVVGRAKSALKKIHRAQYFEELKGLLGESANAEEIVRQIASDDMEKKGEGLQQISAIGDTALLATIVNLIVTRDEEIGWSIGPETYRTHRFILQVAGNRGCALDESYLRRILLIDIPELQLQVIERGTSIADEDLVRLLTSGSSRVKIEILNRAAERPALQPRIYALLEDADASVRASALLASRGTIVGKVPEWYDKRVTAMTKDPSEAVRSTALRVASEGGIIDDRRLTDFLDDESSDVRATAVQLLGEEKFRPAGEKITALLNDSSGYVQSVAIDALKSIYGMELPWDRVIRLGRERSDEAIEPTLFHLFVWRTAKRMGKDLGVNVGFPAIITFAGGEDWPVDDFKTFVNLLTDLRSDKELLTIVEKHGLQESFDALERSIRESAVIDLLNHASDLAPEVTAVTATTINNLLPNVLDERFLIRISREGMTDLLVPHIERRGDLTDRLKKIGATSMDLEVCQSVLRLLTVPRVGRWRAEQYDYDFEEIPVVLMCKAVTTTGNERAEIVREIVDLKFNSEGIRQHVLALLAEFGAREVIAEFRKMVERHADSDEDDINPPDTELLLAMNRLRSPALYEKCLKTMVVPSNNRTLTDDLAALSKESGIDIVIDPRIRNEDPPAEQKNLLDSILEYCESSGDSILPVFEENRVVILRTESDDGEGESDLMKSWKTWLKTQE